MNWQKNPKLLFLLLIVATVILQPFKVGFEPGHHGWVSAHVLSQISHASFANNFLGYTQEIMYRTGVDYNYFDRYPIIFSGFSHILLSPFWDDLSLYIYMARQWMNVLFLLTAWLVWRLTNKLSSPEKALNLTILIISSALTIRYKDMIHFDQPAIIGCLLVMNGIADYELSGRKKMLWMGVLIGPLLGRGYAVIFFLAGWAVVRFISEYRKNRLIMPSLKAIPFIILISSIPLPTIMLGANIYSESKIRNVSVLETSIVESAQHRLGFKEYIRDGKPIKNVSWPSYVSTQIGRSLDLITPYILYGFHVKNYKEKFLHYSSLLPKAIFQILIFVLFLKFFSPFWLDLEIVTRRILTTMLLGGVAWLVIMKSLAAFHEYVTLYLFGLTFIVWMFLSDLMEKKQWNVRKIALAIFISSLSLNFIRETLVSQKVNWQSTEFQKVRDSIKSSGGKVIYVTDSSENFFLDGVKYGDSFYLSGFTLTYDRDLADFQVVKNSVNDKPTLEVHKL